MTAKKKKTTEVGIAKEREPVPGTYRHYKGGFYEVLGIAENPAGEGRYVVYQSLGIAEDLTGLQKTPVVRDPAKGTLTVCTVERFLGPVDDEEHTHGKAVPRFKLISRMRGE